VLNDAEFVGLVNKVVAGSGWRQLSTANQMVEQWSEFVDLCETGYDFSLYEFTNDRSIRDLLERVMFHPSLWDRVQMDGLRAAVEAIDERYRACCRTDVRFDGSDLRWWRACVPILAEGEFKDDLEAINLPMW
jgi:hypothetical protein